MDRNIYIQLLNEGTKVYRPVLASQIEKNVFELKGFDIYDPEDEEWEFLPGTYVETIEQMLDGNLELIAIKEKE